MLLHTPLTAAAAFCPVLSVTARREALILRRHKEPTVWSRDPRTRRRQVAAPAGNPWKLGRGPGGWGGADDHSNQRQVWTKAGVISAVWVTNCWTSGLNGLSGRKTANKEGGTQVELGLLWHQLLSNDPFTLLFNQLIDFFLFNIIECSWTEEKELLSWEKQNILHCLFTFNLFPLYISTSVISITQYLNSLDLKEEW